MYNILSIGKASVFVVMPLFVFEITSPALYKICSSVQVPFCCSQHADLLQPFGLEKKILTLFKAPILDVGLLTVAGVSC
jgi:hypothetical protein